MREAGVAIITMKSQLGTIVGALLLGAVSAVAAEEVAASAINHLGLGLLRQTTGNALVSGWSLQQPLALAYAGAKGLTRQEMARALGYPAEDVLLFESLRRIREASDGLAGAPDRAKALRQANRLFVAQDLPLKPAWLDQAREFFGAEPAPADFTRPEAAARSINQWVDEQTGGKIPAVIPDGGLHPRARLVIVNALAFDLPWDELFTKELTKPENFFVARGRSKTVQLMFKQHRQRYVHEEGFQAVSVPYAGGQFQWVVVLPDDANNLASVEGRLTPARLASFATAPATEVRLWLPRLKLEPPVVRLKALLQKLGIKAAFSDRDADLTGMWSAGDPAERPVLDEVFHRAFLELDEDGTKAASASAVVVRKKNGVPHDVPHQVVRCDRPFLFAIQHVPTGACLFLGRVADPAPDVVADDAGANPKKK